MTPEFLSAVVDALLPGDEQGLPTGTQAGVASQLAEHLSTGRDRDTHLLVLQAVARQAGGEAAFARAQAVERTAVLQAVEEEISAAFKSLVTLVLTEYYEAELVLVAMGWRAEPPQPQGHFLPPFDEALLEKVKRRGKLWRES